MNAWFARPSPPHMPSAIFDMLVRRMSGAVVMPCLCLTAILLLTACKHNAGSYLTFGEAAQFTPKEQVADYRVAQCEHLWQVDDREVMINALYWLRAMDCAGRLTEPQAREEARQVAGSGWDSAFKQGILLDNAGISPVERQRMLEQLNMFRLDFPDALRPLIQTWRDRQTLLLALSDERLRYKRLQESTDKQLEALQAEQGHLQYQLETTRRKLENLTDIERRLSTRKQLSGEMPDTESYQRNNADADKSTTKEPRKQ
ncbi:MULTISPECIES: two-component system QseEF-associated lipoprotein QseG [unclassified Brenneria]|uniref:two-component system QseEF-associated lipoprotein QseG n=1 Tax=unclassified Brenneria TaxID=2634434 RepID=UPI0029C2E0A0|nr:MULTISPECIES: two-component system QseEF-associated lipoprotein QseG [unclassified Brenneria]MDX5629560.1 two-component system QseEF-associated lipoprotein QseG [Brenneria sp. L3-3Z]MDX5696706.1 two-component system QseEF-associated lipoprotein QseG [Brenneria sp. L4-2C]